MKLSLKQKIAVLVAIPSGTFLLFASVMLFKNYKTYLDGQVATENVKIQEATSKWIHQIQIERGKSALFLGGKITENELSEQRTKSDEERKITESRYSSSSLKEELEKSLNQAITLFLSARTAVDEKKPFAEVSQIYGRAIEHLIHMQVEIGQHSEAQGEERKMIALSILETAKESAGRLRANLTSLIAANKPLSTEQLVTVSSLKYGVTSSLDSPALLVTDVSKANIEKFKKYDAWLNVVNTLNKVLEKSNEGNFGVDSKEYFEYATASINQLAFIIHKEIQLVVDAVEANKVSLRNSLWTLGAICILLTALLLGLGWYITRSITVPIQNIMTNLQQATVEVQGASGKMADSGNSLSESTQEQAAALQETVASLDEISSMIQKTTENAKRSQEVSQNSANAAERGQTAVSEMLNSINEINSSNDKIQSQIEHSNQELSEIVKVIAEIAQKTKVINDIVFQTKLLSFNASVEAARAGEAGKGFAVVAEEVGNLATMSGTAAKEISEVLDRSLSRVQNTVEDTKTKVGGLIEESKEKVAAGISTANRCSDVLNEIVTYVREVNQLVLEIATASDEQSMGIQQISTAMNQLDQATQTNAASSQESAQASESLKRQAEGLNSTVDTLSEVVYGNVS
ncbi:MAG: methyl-accepting chemotaxis protein [Oligoflexia bacterium]|nr:MAG: methyl-accepting chemotaxis protein [Oligoflexia bacterium]